jgi:hypothetical protein
MSELKKIKDKIMGKDDITKYHFASDVDNKKLSNKQLAKKAEVIAEQRNKEVDLKEEIKKIKEEREKEIRQYAYERKKPIIDEIAKKKPLQKDHLKKVV